MPEIINTLTFERTSNPDGWCHDKIVIRRHSGSEKNEYLRDFGEMLAEMAFKCHFPGNLEQFDIMDSFMDFLDSLWDKSNDTILIHTELKRAIDRCYKNETPEEDCEHKIERLFSFIKEYEIKEDTIVLKEGN